MKARNQVSWLAIGLLALSFPGVSCGTSLAEIQLPVEQNKQSSSRFARKTDYDN
ncbi:hypothetical protein [Microseira wollei]|uniref:Uncharacterized protein n=1 Tax=Microseira wollei NIES-4236 TaxID=2530354 RepID=A0AAV3XJY9_9CYAN|nr:hypothetical protein [Microseira wollei]GET43232.1 hypothetical protein MiSe_80540 [Microseira wollei NIES-4236]